MFKLFKLFSVELILFIAFLIIAVPAVGDYIFFGIKDKDLSFSLLVLALISFSTMFLTRHYRAAGLGIGLIFLMLFLGEKYLIHRQANVKSMITLDRPANFIDANGLLGYAPKKLQYARFAARYDSTLLFDVTVTTDENGFRKTPNYTPKPDTKSIVFMGCNFAFGYGLNDEEVMPNIVQNLVKNEYKVYNLSCEGYGTHQVLAMAESQMLDTLLKFDPSLFVYPVIDDHLNRIKGYHFWNYIYKEPRYELDENTHEPTKKGYMYIESPLYKKIFNSQLAGLFKKKQADSTDVDLFIAMIKKTKRQLRKKFPSSEFKIILWNANTVNSKTILNKLRENKIEPILITDIVPDYYENIHKYCIYFPHEVHPNADLNTRIARYLYANYFKPPRKS